MSLQWINNKMSNLYAISPLVLLIAYMSFSTTAVKVDVSKMTSEEVFRNIFFGEGELAKQIPQLKELNVRNFTKDQTQIDEAVKFQNEIVRAFHKKHPSYMPSLKDAVVSGDRSKISKTIIQGAKYMDDIVWSLRKGIDKETRAELTRELTSKVNKRSTTDIEKVVTTYVEQTANSKEAASDAVACVAVLVAVVAVAVAIALWVVYTVELAQAESALAHEQIVDSIAKTAN